MAEHMPTTDEVREFFVDGAAGEFIGEDFDRWLAAHDAELRAEVERLREGAGRALVDRDAYRAERDEARQQVADLRAGIEALLPGETVNVYAGGGNLVSQRRVVDPDHLRTLLAGPGEQPGMYLCANPDAPDHPPHGLPLYIESWGTCDARPAPVVPDGTDVRGELLHVLDSHGIDTYIDGTGAEVGVQNLITDILAVVGQGVAEEIERLRDALTDDPDRAALELIVEDAARIARGVGS